MPQHVTNTMRVCTKDSVNVQYDAAVPVKPRFEGGVQAFSDKEYCSDSPFDVPWTVEDRAKAHPSMFSTGNAAMYRWVVSLSLSVTFYSFSGLSVRRGVSLAEGHDPQRLVHQAPLGQQDLDGSERVTRHRDGEPVLRTDPLAGAEQYLVQGL